MLGRELQGSLMGKVSVKQHLKELQWRLMVVAFFFILGAVLAYQFQTQLVPLLLEPLHGEKLVYLNPAGGFSFIFLISVYAGIALSLPVLMQQLYSFLRPALPERAQKKAARIIIGSFILMVAGIAFGYFVAVPNALTFLYGFADQYVDASLTAESYLNFVIAYTIGIGVVFQLPLLLMLLHTIKPMKPGGLIKSEKWVVLVAFIIAAIITPTPDPVNQAIIAIPVIAIYQIGVVSVLLSIAKAHRASKKAHKRAPLSDEQFQNLIAHSLDEEDPVLIPAQPVRSSNTQSYAMPSPAFNNAQATDAIAIESIPETELESVLVAEAIPQKIIGHEFINSNMLNHTTPQSIKTVPTAHTATPHPVPAQNRANYRSIDGIVRQQTIKPAIPPQTIITAN